MTETRGMPLAAAVLVTDRPGALAGEGAPAGRRRAAMLDWPRPGVPGVGSSIAG